ncbi:hypothetical protein AB9E09_11780 [Rhizobium leguminosarum]|uniref:hypothetical protein n=1 Tax=Rhizobium leguminosarum TaxID=384 RepID=UPI003F9B9E12
MSDAMHLTKELAAQIDGFSFANGHGFVETRIGFAVELFFLGGSESRTRLILCDMLRQYHALFYGCAVAFSQAEYEPPDENHWQRLLGLL